MGVAHVGGADRIGLEATDGRERVVIVVTGANGRVGRLVAAALMADGQRVRVVVRDAAAARVTLGDSVDIATADLADRGAVDRAVSNAKAVFLCSPVHPDQVALQGHVVDAAANAGAHVVKLSGLATFQGSFVDSGRWHAETEQAIRESGLPHTFLHPLFFTQNLGAMLPLARARGSIASANPGAKIAMIDVRDIAAVAATLLRDPARAPERTLVLTGPEALSFTDVAGLLSRLTGREIGCRTLLPEQQVENLRKSGQPEWHVRILAQFNEAFGNGLAQQVTTAVPDVLGRPTIAVEASLRAMLNAAPHA